MSDYAAKADDLRKQADKKLNSTFAAWFGNKYEDAAELLEKAANAYKLAKLWNECAESFSTLAECYLKLDSKHEAATAFVEAAKVAAKVQPQKSTELLQRAVVIYSDMGKLSMAAKQLKEIAETNEKAGLKEEAVQFYAQAMDLFETEGASTDATKCKLKIAEFSADLGKYSKAVDLFEDVARRAVDNHLLQYSAKGYLLQAGLCLLCYMKPDDVDIKLDKYKDLDLQFSGSRECKLLEALLAATRNDDEQMFATALGEYDSITRLDPWKTKLLLEAKRRIADNVLGVGGAADADDEDNELL